MVQCPKCNNGMDEPQTTCHKCGYQKRYIDSNSKIGNCLNVVIETYKRSGAFYTALFVIARSLYSLFHLPQSVREEMRRRSMIKRDEQMQPPWLEFSDIPRGSIGWRMGEGEYYLMNWDRWYKKLRGDKRLEYRASYPEPLNWEGFYESREK